MNEKIKIIIADDNKYFLASISEYLKTYPEIEILAITNNDEEEIKLIESLKPDIVVTDLMRNHKYSGLDIIKKYSKKKNAPKFLVISGQRKEEIIKDNLEVAGYITKPFSDYNIILNELKTIKKDVKNYLVDKLSKEENVYLKRIVLTARNKYIEKNYNHINNKNTNYYDETLIIEDNVLDNVLEKCLKEAKSVQEFDKMLSNSELAKYSKELTKKERKVLFYLYWENKQINEIAKIMNIYRGTVRKIRNKAQEKIAKNMFKGGEFNV